MQQTSYAYLRSQDPRNQIYGDRQRGVTASPYMSRPAGPAADLSMYQKPRLPTEAISQAIWGQEAMLRPIQENGSPSDIPNNPQPTSDMGIERQSVAAPASLAGIDTSINPGDEGSMMPPDAAPASSPLPVTAPVKPIEEEDKEFAPEQVQQAQGVMNTIASGVPQGEGMGGATRAADQERVNQDILKVAQSKNPAEAWKTMQKQPFYQNSSFYTGLMGVGLSIMSGKSPIEAFQIGSGMASQDEAKQQLELNRDNLIEQGYSQDSVAAAIASGDPSMLKMRQVSPHEKLALAQVDEERANKEWDRRESIRNQSSIDANKRSFDNQMALASARGEISRENAQFKSEHSVRKTSPKWEKSEELGGITPNFRDKLQQSYRPVINVLSSRNKWMAPTEAAISKLGTGANSQENAAQQRAAIENLTKLIQGGLASINGEVMNELTGDPDWVNNKLNKISMMSGQGPTDANIKWLKALGTEIQEIDKEATKYQVAPLVESLILDAKLPPENAIRAANSIFAPGSVRLTTEEFKEWSRGHSKVHDKTFPDDKPPKLKGGALSGSSDTSWFTK